MTLPSALEGHAVLLVVDGIGYLTAGHPARHAATPAPPAGPPSRGHHHRSLSTLLGERDRRCPAGAASG